MKCYDRQACVFCSSEKTLETSVISFEKVGIAPWGQKTLECIDCGSQWSTPVPIIADFETMYRKRYAAQDAGLVRWRRTFPGKSFDQSRHVLEIGGGNVGIKNDCRGQYYTWEFNDAATFNGPFDSATEEQLFRARSLCITDIVTLDCFEHVLEPKTFIANCAKVLNTSGLLYLHHGELKGKDEVGRRAGRRQAAHINCPTGEGMESATRGLFKIIKGDAGTCASDRDASWILERL